MKLIDADLALDIIGRMREKFLPKIDNRTMIEYFIKEFEIYSNVLSALRECTSPTYTVIQAQSDEWVECSKELPPKGVNVELTFRDTFHTHPSWEKIQVLPAWICNVDEEHPEGEWAIEGRLGHYVIDIEDGIAWKPLPAPYKKGVKNES